MDPSEAEMNSVAEMLVILVERKKNMKTEVIHIIKKYILNALFLFIPYLLNKISLLVLLFTTWKVFYPFQKYNRKLIALTQAVNHLVVVLIESYKMVINIPFSIL